MEESKKFIDAMPRALPLFHYLPPACDEWKLEAALREAGYPVTVKRDCRRGVKVTASEPFPVPEVRAFIAGWTAGAMAN